MENKEYYPLPLEDCMERITECYNLGDVIRAYIRDNIDNDEAWNSDLMALLCEYYSISCRYVELMSELILTPPHFEDDTQQELIYVDARNYAILTSYSKLMLVDEAELKYKYRVHLFFQ